MNDSNPKYTQETEEAPVDVAAIMRQVRRRIAERHGNGADQELAHALHVVNTTWDKVHEPLHMTPGRSLPAKLWGMIRMRLHHEVRGYLDTMIFRQTEFNAAVVRSLNGLARRGQYGASQIDLESLRDEVIQLNERVRQLEEQLVAEPHD